jgi:hypothetical protein
MPLVRMLLFTNSSGDAWRYYSSELAGIVTEWEEITDDELDWLAKYIRELDAPYGLHYVLVVQDAATVKYHVDSIRHLIDAEKAKIEAEEAKRKERAAKAAETKRRNLELKERAMLEKLKGKYGT